MKKKTFGWFIGFAMSFMAIVAINGCSSNNSSSDSSTDQSTQDSSTTATTDSSASSSTTDQSASSGPVATDTVTISGMKFQPADIIVSKGQKVTFINNDIVTHDVSHFPDKKWTSGPLDPGKSWTKVFDDSTTYFCSIHPTMIGKVEIK